MLLWTEYKAEHADGYENSRFAELYHKFERKPSVLIGTCVIPARVRKPRRWILAVLRHRTF